MSLPFPLHTDHKKRIKALWKSRGIIFMDDEYFEYVYNEYIQATNCDLCNIEFPNSQNRHLDHDHITGEIRNIVCLKCNIHKKEIKYKLTNTGEEHISKCNDKNSKTGYCFQIRIFRDGKHIIRTHRNTLEKAIICRDEFIEAHPEIYS